MPFPTFWNPNVVQPQVQQFPLPGSQDDRLMRLQMLMARRPRGLLDQVSPEAVGPPQGLVQPVGDILQFRRRQGLLGVEGAGAARPGGAGPRIGGGLENIPQGGTVPLTTKGPPLSATERMDLMRVKGNVDNPALWGPKTPGWDQLSMSAKKELIGKPIKGPSAENAAKGPSAEDTAQTSFSLRDYGKIQEQQGNKAAAKYFNSAVESDRQQAQAFRNEWSAFGHKQGWDANTTAKAAQDIKDAGASKGISLSPDRIKFLLALARQKGLL